MANQEDLRDPRIIGKVLLTGHTGFKGVWTTLLLESLGIEVVGLALPPEPDSLYHRLGRAGAVEEYLFDISDAERVTKVISDSQVKTVVHMAAQPLVLHSYANPVKTFETNVMGTVNILHGAFSSNKVETVAVVTTDKVYENKNTGKRFVESDSLAGRDPYSASKVGTEAAAAAWSQISRIYGGPTVITARAGNVIGGGDLAKDRIIPDIIRGVIQSSEVEIRNPNSTRPWQHALDPIVGYLLAAAYGTLRKENFSVNFGPTDSSLPVSEVVESAKSIFGERIRFKFPKESRKSLESHFLDLDSTWAQLNLDWFPARSQSEAINQTFLWWDAVLAKEKSASEACADDINRFIKAHKL